MSRIVPIDATMLGDASAFLAGQFRNPPIPPRKWELLLNPPWGTDAADHGLALVDGQSVVGLLGMVSKLRRIAGTDVLFRNLTSFALLPEYRRESVSLLRPLLGMRDCVLTNFSPQSTVDFRENLVFLLLIRVDSSQPGMVVSIVRIEADGLGERLFGLGEVLFLKESLSTFECRLGVAGHGVPPCVGLR